MIGDQVHKSPADTNLKLFSFSCGNEFWLEQFYDLYSRIFTLPEEREPIEGFRKVLELNQLKSVQDEFGPLNERITLAIDEASNAVVGASNYILYGYPALKLNKWYGASGQLNFICVDPAFRNSGIAHFLLGDLESELQRYASTFSNVHAFLTCEQNNPERMSEEQISIDREASQIDPYERLRWWRKLGFRRLDFPYRQPPLNPGQKPCAYLDYFVRFVPESAETPSFPTSILVEHLRRFFAVSVGKLAIDMGLNEEWNEQLRILDAVESINVV